MLIHHNFKLKVPITRSVITMGSFDGVHLGHQKILERVLERSAFYKAESALITFDQHPRKILMNEEEAPGLITTPEERRYIFNKLGIDHLICLEFNQQLASMEASDFIREMFVNHLHAIHIVTGYGHRFGKGGAGNHELLQKVAPKYGFSTEMIPRQDIENNRISSTIIRDLLAIGDVYQARKFLGYPYEFSGVVIHGGKIGKTLGFPTANLKPLHPDKIIPAGGVYAIRAMVADNWYKGMMNIGTRPTFNNSGITIEAHLFGFRNDIYGETIKVVFEKRIRDERKFSSAEELILQLKIDKTTSLELLQNSQTRTNI